MKRYGFFISLLFILLVCSTPALAHELVPEAIIQYVRENPNATPDEIEAYAEQTVPAYAERFPSGEKVFEAVTNQSTNPFDTLWDFFRLGVEHILSGPDHILFVISLLLVFVSVKNIIKLTGTFTIAHSLTLILATVGVVTLPSRIVEFVIALSIAVMAFGSVYLKESRFELSGWRKLGLIFFFGLFHGLGFAGLLHDLGVGQSAFVFSLLSFNIGIEFGQLLVIAIVLPILLLLQKTKYYALSIQILGTFIGMLGLLWAIERLFGYTAGFIGF